MSNTNEKFITDAIKTKHACEFKQDIVRMALDTAVLLSTADTVLDVDGFNLIGTEKRLASRIISDPLQLPTPSQLKILIRAELKLYAYYDKLLPVEFNAIKDNIAKKSKVFYDIALNTVE